ncbi:hypothetical protein EJ05DRAFT_499612 [Pseudovirgaria hyperparasitica]|uniref:Rhodopsin domain-containing protein n=1 Tax=Pseudovirgaria hyperparasitica TaxID=470096 RepID=A0A6A6WDK8_9PEZI|nr:uncharacterized protein EJ05DRAFT_499612 [Pseudovirgaria hyperparasitica]KAF2759191.1 hypothetical protein EJ05DRAFT_499612 [Pseudovirgaria hyperparasitica]
MTTLTRQLEHRGLVYSDAVSANDHSPFITVAMVLCLTCSCLFYIFRLTTRWPFAELFRWDDVLITLATLFGFGQAVATASSIGSGLGQREHNLSQDAQRHTYWTLWISNVLYILALCFARAGCSLFIYRLTRARRHTMASLVVSMVIAMWGFACTIIVGVACSDFDDIDAFHVCLKQSEPQWIGIFASGSVTELMLLALPIYLVWNLHAPFSTKFIVVTAFWFRLPISALGGLRLWNLMSAFDSPDVTWSLVKTAVYTQAEMHLCIVSATIPCMRPFLRLFNTGYLSTTTGQMDPHDMYRKRAAGKPRSRSNTLSESMSRSRFRDRGFKRQVKNPEMELGPLRPDHADTRNLIECRKPSTVVDAESLREHGSDQIMVRRTVDIRVSMG